MTPRRLSSEEFVAALEAVEHENWPPRLHPEDAAHLAVAQRLFGLRERPPAPGQRPWQLDGAGVVGASNSAVAAPGAASRGRNTYERPPLQRSSATVTGSATALLPLPPKGARGRGIGGELADPVTIARSSPHDGRTKRAPDEVRLGTWERRLTTLRLPIGQRSRLDVAVLTAVLAAVALITWQSSKWVRPQSDPLANPTVATSPAVAPEQRGTAGAVFGPADESTAEASHTPSSTALPGYPPPVTPAVLPGDTATPGIPSPAATPSAAPTPVGPSEEPPSATRDRAASSTATPEPSAPPYPGPAETATPEPRVTRVGPPPVPTSVPTVPTLVPTPPPSPTMRPLPPTPTAVRPIDTPGPTATTMPTPTGEPSALPTAEATSTTASRRISR